jgi:prephenate dehydrogenase
MKTIAFIGLGLIGGSVAKAIRKYHPDYHILAYDVNREALSSALSGGTIDGVCEAKDERFHTCDYIFLCAPVEYNLEYLRYLKSVISPDTIVTDVGSVKGMIHEAVADLKMESCFIGGHPMAGSEKTGFEHANDRLIENAYYIITPGGEVGVDKLTDFSELIASLGAIPMVLTCEEHDFITAGVSHLPHIIASSLVNLVKMLDNDAEYMKTIAAGGFRDITRIASSSPVMWQQICLENNKNISEVLDQFIRMLVQIRCSIDNQEADALYQMFASSRDYRDSIDVVDNGPIRRAYVLYLDIADKAGGIATIATILAMDNISIKNIGIIHNREFEEGVLKIEFYEEDAMNRGAALLRKRNYIVYERQV